MGGSQEYMLWCTFYLREIRIEVSGLPARQTEGDAGFGFLFFVLMVLLCARDAKLYAKRSDQLSAPGGQISGASGAVAEAQTQSGRGAA